MLKIVPSRQRPKLRAEQRQTGQRELQEVLCLTASVLQTQGQPFIQAIQKALTQSLTTSFENCDIFLEVQIHKKKIFLLVQAEQ